MKQINLFSILTILMSMTFYNSFAFDIYVQNADGKYICYNYINDNKELEVTYGCNYEGNIVIPEEVTFMNRTRKVTSINEHAFYECSTLKSVTIPNSVTSIKKNTFLRCTNLISISLSNSLKSIGDSAFAFCNYLKYVDIPNGVTTIGDYAFFRCCWLSVKIPNSVTSIGEGAFCGCEYMSSCTIPSSVTSIKSRTFYGCQNLTYISLPNSLTTIEDKAFQDCTYLQNINLPNNLTTIGDYAFSRCINLGYVNLPNNLTTIGDYAFGGCISFTSLTIPNSVTSIGEGAFIGADILTVTSLNENPFKIIGKSKYGSVFNNNTFINATLYVPAGSIEKYKATEGWKDFTFIEEIKPQIIEAMNSDGQMLYYLFKNNTEFAVTYRGDEYYSYNEYYGDIVIPEYVEYNGVTYPVTTIEPDAFSSCNGLTSVIIPNTVTSIGESAFSYCTNLTSVTIGNKVTEIGDFAFQDCKSLTSIIIPCSVSLIGFNAFEDCSSLKSIIVEKGNSNYDSRDNCNAIIKTNDNSLILGCMNTTIPNSVTNIEAWAFCSCTNLTSITIPNSVTRIGILAFAGCTGLTSITIPKSVQEIGAGAFFDANLTSVISQIDEPFEIQGSSFGENTYNNGILYVPIGSKGKYENTYGWNNFVHIQEGAPNNITLINFNDVLIQNISNVLKISGAPRDSQIIVYNLFGMKVGSARVTSESTDVITSLQTGEVGIVKIGEKSVRVVIK